MLELRPSSHHGHEAATETLVGCKMQVGQAKDCHQQSDLSAGPGVTNTPTDTTDSRWQKHVPTTSPTLKI